ncbi:MAG: hypothetical protein V5A85_09935 [Haloarculaceae archaeon]
MHIEIEIPDKYADKLETVEEVDPTIREQIEIEVLPQVLRLINEGHRQIDERDLPVADAEGTGGGLSDQTNRE